MKGLRPAWLVVVGLVGCAGPDSHFPDQPGLTWTYSVRTGFGAEHVEDLRIVRRLTVAQTEGVELSGPLGASRLAWRDHVLWLERTSNAGFVPPVPLLAQDRRSRSWQGEMHTNYGVERARGRLSHRSERLEIGGRGFDSVRTEFSLDRPLGATSIITWFAPEIGIVRQEQRTRGALDLRLEWVAGPRRTQ